MKKCYNTPNVNIKKYLFIAIGTFLAIIIVAFGISARFDFSNIAIAPYQFIEDFFINWSPALSAVATFIVAILAFLAIYEGRRSHRLAVLDQQYSKIEEWIRDNVEAFRSMRLTIELSELEATREKELESENDSLGKKRKMLESEMHAGKSENNEELREITEKLIGINKELLSINERKIDFIKEGFEESRKTIVKIAGSDITIAPLIYSIGDVELKKLYESYASLVTKKTETLERATIEDSLDIFKKPINEMRNALQNLLVYIYHLRNKMIS